MSCPPWWRRAVAAVLTCADDKITTLSEDPGTCCKQARGVADPVEGTDVAEGICIIDACERPRKYNLLGLCSTHYNRQRQGRWARPVKPKKIRPTAEQRFWAKVEKTGTCWVWVGARNDRGYGNFVAVKPKNIGAHRYAYELMVGPIPEGFDIDHVKANGCTSRACVKAIADEYGPAHLEAVTRAENLNRARPPRPRAGEPVTLREAARLIGVHSSTVEKWRTRGAIEARLLTNGFYSVPWAEVERIKAARG